ncbi:hypothetical protein BB559_001161 [Furculomyces boomerangus]|uniref:Aminoglycoside phosphotransferase domain-containing protein n=2 Tax=Harpellales TaxID=61421 RepID=A0A2T9Z303_9FUNG|nr:hypothetical protein BB559_001161 [Furculomyces boomerangus]PVZ98377.1 hypothetical protein BB558_005600 [Smittium angustum]
MVNEEVLGKYLLANGMSINLPIRAQKFSFGQSNPTFLILDANNKKFVVRKKPDGELISKTAHAVEREYRIIKALGENTSVPVPKVYLLCEDSSVIGTPFYVMEFLDGRIFIDPDLEGVDKNMKIKYWEEMIRVLSLLHSIDYKKVGLEGFGKPTGYYTRQCKSLLRVHDGQAASVSTKTGKAVGPLPRFYDLTRWLEKTYCPDETTIVHGDYKHDNIVFHKTEPRIIGILDWELSTIGNPRADLSNLVQYMQIPKIERMSTVMNPDPAFRASLENKIITPESEGIPDEEFMVKSYCSATNKKYPLEGWVYSRVFSLYRNAVIAHGIAARFARGQASSAFAGITGSKGPLTVMRAINMADTISEVPNTENQSGTKSKL